MEKTGANVSVLFVPAFSKAAVVEAIDAEIPLAVVITEGIAVHDSAAFWACSRREGQQDPDHRPELPGSHHPGQSNAGIIPGDITKPGRIGLVSKSGTLTYQMMYELRDIGFSSAVGIGGDPVIGTTHIDALAAFEADPETDLIVMIGEIGGDAEERAADFIAKNVTKPVVGYVAGFTAPEGKTMGHAGAIVSGSSGTAQAKKEALEAHAASRSARRRPRPPSWRARSSAPDAGSRAAETRCERRGPAPLHHRGAGPRRSRTRPPSGRRFTGAAGSAAPARAPTARAASSGASGPAR